MKKTLGNNWIIGLLSLGFILLTFYLSMSSIVFSKPVTKLDSFDLIDMKSGEFIFRKGMGVWSPLFSSVSKESFSHVGVLYIENGQRYVLHSEADDYTLEGGVQKTLFRDFIADSEFFSVRENRMSEQKKNRFMEELLSLWQKNIPFDDDFELNDSSKLYCTEFLWKAAQNIGVNLGEPINVMGKNYITVDVVLDSPWVGKAF